MDQTVRLTIREIAKEAGVSTQTVSRVINDRPDVAEHTRLRIQEIIDRTGYYPSPHARGLTLSQNKIIGVIATTPAEYGPAQSLAGLDQEAVRRGYTLSFILVHDETDIQPAIRKMRAQNVGGLIWSVTGQIGADFEAVARDLVALPFPTVIFTSTRHAAFKTVEIDNFWGAQLAVSHLLEKGYKNIGIITGPLNELAANERFLGWRYSLQEASQDADQSLIAHGSWNPDSGYRAAQLLLEQNPNLDAIFSSNDEMAIGAMRAIMEAGYKIPQDYGIVGFDDILTSRFLTPSLTTIRQDINASSQIAVQELIQLIENDVNQNHQPEQVITLPPELIIRESTRRK